MKMINIENLNTQTDWETILQSRKMVIAVKKQNSRFIKIFKKTQQIEEETDRQKKEIDVQIKISKHK